MHRDDDNQKALDELDRQVLANTREANPEAEPQPLDTLFGYATEDLADVTLSQSISVQRARFQELAAGLGIRLKRQPPDYDERCMLDSAIEAVRDLKPTNELERNLAYNFVAINKMARDAALRAQSGDIDPVSSDKAAQLFLKGNGAALKNAETIDKLRNRGTQQITVQHVNVNPGAQAVVGTVDARKVVHANVETPLEYTDSEAPVSVRSRRDGKVRKES
ncbi:hypothetical protein SAMN05444000_1426 [Shimia gijangensis]|uniref:Uncharacterized protein n=2 Tax=Shimia gijangensis TaxID=1470563 RepID=A0A1M6TMT6_9RHOB|nr:hypothetical protein SAMN05444000_1426 [Shimia gijangensis]